MEVCPAPMEVTDFQFKQFYSARVFPAIDYQSCFGHQSNTVTASNKHGLLIVGTLKGFQIINLARIVAPDASEFVNETDDYPKREYNINAQPSHIALNCDETLLSVAHKHIDDTPIIRIYRMASLTNQSKNKVVKLPVGPPGTCITDFSWNPVIPDLLSFCVSNGCLYLYTHDDSGKKVEMLPPEKQVTCVSWSPKGKQLLAGDKFGHLVQYKPDLKDPQKVVPPPKDLFPNQCSIVNVIWLTVYQYGVVYMNTQSTETHFSIVNAPKNGPFRYVSYDEICFNSGTVRPHQFYLMHLPTWNILIVSSSNSTEVAVLSLLDDKVSWQQWIQEDSTRLDLPVDRNKSETYPVGVTIATCSQLKIKWSETNFLEPMPTLSIISNDGLVLLFHVINTRPNVVQLCSPSTPLPDHIFGTLANPLVPNTKSSQVSAVSTTPTSFNMVNPVSFQGQSPVIEISTKQTLAAPSPLALSNKPQISITPLALKVSQNTQVPAAVSLFPIQAPPTQTQKSDSQFQAMTQSIFQSVIQSNDSNIPEHTPDPNPQNKCSPIPPTIVKTSLEKQQLIVEPLPLVTKSSPEPRTGSIKGDDLELFLSLEENISELLKSYRVKIGSFDLDLNLTKINDRVDKLENFYQQLEDTTKSLANDITVMKNALNEAFIYAHESKAQIERYERKKTYDKDPLDNIMISKKSINPIVERNLIALENEIRKSAYFVRSCIQDSRPILQHLELVKSGKNMLNFQSILQSINKEKTMISRCSLMLDEINRDVLRMYGKHHIFKGPKSSQQNTIDKKKTAPKPVDKFKSLKDQIKIKPKISQEKLKALKNLHMTQVLEPIRHSELTMTNSQRLRTSDLLKIFQSPVQKKILTPQKPKQVSEPIPEVKQEVEVKPFSPLSTPVLSKAKASLPTALFTQPLVPGPVPCNIPEITKNTATFVIDTSKSKANATKLTFDDSIAAFSNNMAKNMFTSTPTVTTAVKLPSSAAPTAVGAGFGSTFTKLSEPAKTPAFQFSIPTSTPGFLDTKISKPAVSVTGTPSLFKSEKLMFGGVVTTSTTQTKSATVLSFGTSTTSPPFSISSSTPATSFEAVTKPPFSISSPATLPGTFNFSLSSTPKLSFDSTLAATAPSTTAPFSILSSLTFNTSTTVATAVVSTPSTVVSTPSFNIAVPAKSTTPAPTSLSSLSFGTAFSETSKTSTATKVSQTSITPPVSTALPKFENGTPSNTHTKSPTPDQKTPQKEGTTEKKQETIVSDEHPVSASSSNISFMSLLSSSTNFQSESNKESAQSDGTSISSSTPPLSKNTESEAESAVPTAAPGTFNFSSSASPFGGAPKSGTPAFSFLSAASEASLNTSKNTTATYSSPSESIASTLSSVSSSTSVMLGSTVSSASLFSTTSAFAAPTTSASPFISTPSTPPRASNGAVVPTTPSTPSNKPVISDASVPQATSAVEAPATPSTPTSTVPPFNNVQVTPTTPVPVFPTASVFGNSTSKETVTTTAEIGNLFGRSLGFGSPTTPSTQSSSVFGQSGGNLFSSSSRGSFGQSSGSIFEKSSTPVPNVFGQGGSVFGQQAPPASGSVFAKSGSVFGDTKPTSPFGSSTSSPFGQQTTGNTGTFGSSPFGNPAKTDASPFFRQSTFGNTPTSSNSVFGAPTTSSSSVFGQSASPFGQAASFGQSSSSTFGTGGGAFGAKSNFGQSGGSIFAGKSSFGQSGSSIFGSGGTSPSTGSVFGGSPSFGSSGGSAFGQASPSFSSSGFGSTASFGSNPTFGGAPAFGNASPNKIFGSSEPASAQPASGFGLTTGGPLSFGNLAQQTPQTGFGSFTQAQPNAGTFGAPSSPGFGAPPPAGGSSFSSWR